MFRSLAEALRCPDRFGFPGFLRRAAVERLEHWDQQMDAERPEALLAAGADVGVWSRSGDRWSSLGGDVSPGGDQQNTVHYVGARHVDAR